MARRHHIHTLDSLRARCVEEGNCWLWQGATDGHGKPSMRNRGKVCSPRRVVRELADGKPIPPGMVATSTCGNPLCISPQCSEAATEKRRGELAAKRGAFKNKVRDMRVAATKRAKSAFGEDVIQAVRNAPNAMAAAASAGMSHSYAKAIRRGESRKNYGSPFAGLGA